MPIYTGYHCPVCGKPFAASDDIVVCPDCGTPHHRDCYRGLGHCAYEDKHSEGHRWQPQPEQPKPEQGAQGAAVAVCPRCGSNNLPGNLFCQVCGQQLTPPQGARPQSAAPGGAYPGQNAPGYQPSDRSRSGYQAAGASAQSPASGAQEENPFLSFIENQIDYSAELAPGVTTREVCDYVGPNNLPFALRFQMLARQQNGISVNWSAFFFSFFYCFYRKMYKLGAALTALAAVSMLPVFWFAYPFFKEVLADQGVLTVEALTSFVSPASQNFAMASLVFRGILFFISLFCGFYFNRAYFKSVCQSIRSLRQNGHYSSGSAEYSYALARKGGVNSNAVLLAVCTLLVAYILVCVAFTYNLML